MAKSQLFQSFLLPFLVVAVCICHLLSIATANTDNETDRQALLEFKSQIAGDPFGILSSWNSSIHFCHWLGVACGRRHQRVTALDLHSNKLGGSISSHIGNMSFLRLLDISNNSFRDGIPPQLGRLRRLQVLKLHNNSLTGEIPSNISHCSKLVYLSLNYNNLVGKIPVEIGQLTKLEYLWVSRNRLTGTVPPFANCSFIMTLVVSENSLTGDILETLGQLRNIMKVSLYANKFTGNIPSSLSNLTSIQILDMGENQFQGNISPDIFTSLKNLEFFSLLDNQFTGTIPSSVSNASKIDVLQLTGNNLTGQVPDLLSLTSIQIFMIAVNKLGSGGPNDLNFICSLRNASILLNLGIGYNNFGGAIPQCIGNLSSTIRYLYINNNKIQGSIDTGIGSLTNLWVLDLKKNKLSGEVPKSFGNLRYLNELIMEYNNLSGLISEVLGNLTNLFFLDISDNNFQGVIPSSLGKCKSLQVLDLSRNNFNGTLPAEVMGLSSLTLYFGFSENHLIGPLPKEIGNLRSLHILDASGNMISGEIPRGLGKCMSLEIILLDSNLFQGSIPSSLSSLRGIEQLNLSHNNLSGRIPDFLATFRFLTKLNLDFNEFEGMIPTKGVFRNATATSLKGNKMLCGGVPEFHLPACNFHVHKSKDKLKTSIALVSVVLGISMVWLLIILLKGRKKKEDQASSNSGYSILNLSYHDLYRATDGFSTSKLIGVSFFGSVYKGVLEETQQLIAVKVINLMHHGAIKSFLAECQALKNIRHRNLVKILSVCSSIDHQGHDFKALVYEFMENGSLEEWLHPSTQTDATHQVERNLTINQRLNIAVDVAMALEYLHFECGTPLVHCDIKPSNILLDDELVGHVSDFGIAKFLSRDILSANHSSSLGLRGTIGYAAPEYGLGNDISTKGDVYSYGILLLEMFTRKRPTNEAFQDGSSLHELAKKSLRKGVLEIIDLVILQEIGKTKASTSNSTNINKHKNWSKVVECLTSIIEIGVACSSESLEARIDMREVNIRLHSIQAKHFRQRA